MDRCAPWVHGPFLHGIEYIVQISFQLLVSENNQNTIFITQNNPVQNPLVWNGVLHNKQLDFHDVTFGLVAFIGTLQNNKSMSAIGISTMKIKISSPKKNKPRLN